jgi:hypothetical protein
MIKIHSYPPQIAAGVNDNGNVEIHGIDEGTGLVCTIEIESSRWNHVYQQLGRLRGVGIYKANRANLILDGNES